MKELKNVLEEKYERVVELVKEWQDLGLASYETIIDVKTRYNTRDKEWIVEVLNGEEIGDTIEEALDKQIRMLESDEDYVRYKLEQDTRERGIQELKEAGWI